MDRDSEKAAFLPGGVEADEGFRQSMIKGRKSLWSFKAICFHAALLLLYSGAFVATYFRQLCPQNIFKDSVASPTPSFPLEPQVFTVDKTSYSGPPSKAEQHAWDELLEGINLRVPTSDLGPNQTSIELADGQRLAWLDVHHQLHCVKYLKHWTYREFYSNYEEITSGHKTRLLNHLDHCLELLRQQVMCRPDETVMTFEWVDGQEKPSLKLEGPPRMCVNWDQWTQSLKPKVINGADMDRLKNPNYGLEARTAGGDDDRVVFPDYKRRDLGARDSLAHGDDDKVVFPDY